MASMSDQQIVPIADRFNNELVVFTHISMRYNYGKARDLFRKRLPSFKPRIVIAM